MERSGQRHRSRRSPGMEGVEIGRWLEQRGAGPGIYTIERLYVSIGIHMCF